MIASLLALHCAVPLFQDTWTLVNQELLEPMEAQIHDMDGDGVRDLVVGSSSDGLLVWSSGLGGGTFGAYRVISTDLFGFQRMAVFDADGDGDLDLAAALESSRKITYHENLGAGRFEAPVSVDSATEYVKDVVASDLDGDGDQDLVAGLTGTGLVVWYENLGGSFAARSPLFSSGGFIEDLDAADIDGDGDQDLLYADIGTDTFGLVPNLGGGVFGTATVISAGAQGASQIAAGDVDGDGAMDVVTAGIGLAWYSLTPGFAYTERGRIAQQGDTFGLALLDSDSSGTLEIASVTNALGLGGRLFEVDSVTGSISEVASFLSSLNESSLTAEDVDGDGNVDLMGTTGGVYLGRGDGAGSFAAGETIPSRYFSSAPVALTDLDGDGDREMITTATSSPIGSNRPVSIIAAYDRLSETAIGPLSVVETGDGELSGTTVRDLDLDGLEDLYYLERSFVGFGYEFELIWMRRLGTGTFAAPTTMLYVPPTLDGFDPPKFGDVDGDGDLDLVHCLEPDFNLARLVWYQNDGTMAFSGPQLIESLPGTDLHEVRDLDQDGRADLLTSTLDHTLRVHYASASSGTGFDAPELSGTAGRTRFVLAVDADGDGDLDAFVARRSSMRQVEWHENLGSGFGSAQLIQSLPDDLRSAYLGDWDGDGDKDVLTDVRGTPASELEVFENTGAGFAPFARAVTVGDQDREEIFLEGVADANGDGDVDLVVSVGRGQLRIYENPLALGTSICPGNPTSASNGADLVVSGSIVSDHNRMVLTATELPPFSTTLFLASQQTGFVPMAGGGQGDLCLGGDVGRYLGPGEVQQASLGGLVRLRLDLTKTPDPVLGLIPATAGQSWSFQAWFRDANPTLTSNFSAAITVVLQ